MKYLITIVLIIQGHGWLMGQALGTFLKDHAIEVNLNDSSSNSLLLRQVSQYKLIMMGEMHGTQEPARFVSYLVKQLTGSGKDVQLGIEIPETMVTAFIRQPSRENLLRSDFFSKGFPDGKANEDWLNLILQCQANPKVKVFYYDVEQGSNPDSLMYSYVKKRLTQYPQSVTVLLGGNFHNRMIPSRSGKTMGVYFSEDKTLALGGRICAINHHYKYGTMKNSSGSGLQLRVIEAAPTQYSEATPFKAYFSLLPENTSPYTAIFYSEKVTAAEVLNAPK